MPRQLVDMPPQKIKRFGAVRQDCHAQSMLAPGHAEPDMAKLLRFQTQFHYVAPSVYDGLPDLTNHLHCSFVPVGS